MIYNFLCHVKSILFLPLRSLGLGRGPLKLFETVTVIQAIQVQFIYLALKYIVFFCNIYLRIY